MRRGLVLIGVAFWVGICCTSVRGSFRTVSDSVETDFTAHTTTFTVRFDCAPDFLTLDQYGRQKNSFQYYIDRDLDGEIFSPDADVLIVRGEEIHSADALRVREALGDDPSKTSGGWGPVCATVPFDLNGDTLSFTLSWNTFDSSDQRFRYALETYEFGSMNDELIHSIPLPAAFWAGGAMLAVVVLVQVVRARHHHLS